MQAAPDRRSDTALVVLQCTLNQKLVFIGALRILKAVVSFWISSDKVYSLSEKCHTCMLWHSKHVQLAHCLKSRVCVHICRPFFDFLESLEMLFLDSMIRLVSSLFECL